MTASMKKSMIKMLLVLALIFGGIFGFHAIKMHLMHKFMQEGGMPPITVSSTKVTFQKWPSQIKSSGSLRAIRGVDVTTELAGLVKTIYFTPGSDVQAGVILVQLNADSNIAQLNSLQAQASLAQTVYNRDKAQYAIKAVSKATLDADEANLKNLQAQVAEQLYTVNKKSLKAPFNGRLGISAVNPGQFLNPGDKVVTLQTLDPIYIDFFVPQQSISQLHPNQVVTVLNDAFPNQTFSGKVTTINPQVDVATRNVEVEATIENPQHDLLPGMFATAITTISEPKTYLTLPQTAISFNPYGEIVFVIKEKGKDATGKPAHIVEQKFVTVGEARGDQIVILNGLHEGEEVVTSGQLKLKNGSSVIINNSVVPANNPKPAVKEA